MKSSAGSTRSEVASHRAVLGRRVGVGWLGVACGRCRFCLMGSENLCDNPQFTGYTRNGGFATHMLADARFAFELDGAADPVSQAPLLCAGLIGWRCLKKAGDGKRLGLFGFGAAAHIIAQVAKWQGRQIYAFTRPGDAQAQELAISLGCAWAGGSNDRPPDELDAAIIFAPVGDLVPTALSLVRKGGRVVCGGIHMSDIPAMPYRLLWGERELVSVANLTRSDGREFFPVAKWAGVHAHTTAYPLASANQALDDLRAGKVSGAAVLVPVIAGPVAAAITPRYRWQTWRISATISAGLRAASSFIQLVSLPPRCNCRDRMSTVASDGPPLRSLTLCHSSSGLASSQKPGERHAAAGRAALDPLPVGSPVEHRVRNHACAFGQDEARTPGHLGIDALRHFRAIGPWPAAGFPPATPWRPS